MTSAAVPDDAERRVRDSFARQRFMGFIGARLARVAHGTVEIELPVRDDLTQQHGFVHAGAVTAIADSACGYAALSTMDADAGVLSVEFKINLLAPARGTLLRALGTAVKSGRTLTVCRADVVAEGGGASKLIAVMQATMMSVRERADVSD